MSLVKGRAGGHTGLWNIGMWHFDPHGSFQSQMDQKLFNLIPKVIIEAPKTFRRFRFCIKKNIFFFKQVISEQNGPKIIQFDTKSDDSSSKIVSKIYILYLIDFPWKNLEIFFEML